MSTNTFPMTGPKKPSRLKSIAKKGWPIALAEVIGIGVGVGVGGAVAGYDTSTPGKQASAPAPKVVTETVTPEPEVVTEEVTVEVSDPTCAALATEYRDMLLTMTEEVALPYSDVVIELVDMMQYGADAGRINAQTDRINEVSQTTEDLTARMLNTAEDYKYCEGKL